MKPKPGHLLPEHATQFADPSVVAAYRFRPPYPEAAARFLASLVRDAPASVLEVGCGPGRLTRLLAPLVDTVDAVEPSAGMLAEARRLTWGSCANVTWIHAPIETARLQPPYALAVAAHSLHWTDWEVALPKLAGALAPGGRLAIVRQRFAPLPWADELEELLARHTTNPAEEIIDLIPELAARGLFEPEGSHRTGTVSRSAPVEDYVESYHSANGFSRDRMTPEAAVAFDRELTALVRRHCPGGRIVTERETVIDYGRPRSRGA